MRTVTYRLEDLQRAVITIGFVGENEHTHVIFDAKRVLDDYPTALPSLTVRPPDGDPYPAVVAREGDLLTWEILDSDLTKDGLGEFQLTFVVDTVVAKTFIGKTRIYKSLMPTGEVPDPIDDWITQANTALSDIPQTINDALEAAKESGEFDGPPGDDGFSPIVSTSDIAGGHRVTIQDATHTEAFDVMDGRSGADVIDDNAGAGETGKTWSADKLVSELAEKADTSDIPDVSGLYTKPGTGIPKTDLASGVQGSLGKADTAYQKPVDGIPKTDLASGVQGSLGKADTAYQKPSGGIPATDLASGVVPDVTGKADKVTSATSGNFAGLDSNGNLTDSGKKPGDFLTQHQDITGKADKVSSAISGNFAGLDANGNLTDSGHKHSDYLTQHQDISGKTNNSIVAVDYADLTYPVAAGTHCIHDGVYYAAKQDIPTSEAWTAAHWDSVRIGDELSSQKSAINSTATEETGQELLGYETNESGLLEVTLLVIGTIFNNLPQDEPATDIMHSLELECERLQAIYDNWMSERSA